VAKEIEEKIQGSFDLPLRLREDSNGRSKGRGTWTTAAIVADWGEHGELVVGEPHGSVRVADGALEFVGEQRDSAFLDGSLKLRV
jgi:hypothetical protein